MWLSRNLRLTPIFIFTFICIFACICLSNISQQSIKVEQDLKQQLENLREQNKNLENEIKRMQDNLEKPTNKYDEDTNRIGKTGKSAKEPTFRGDEDGSKNITVSKNEEMKRAPTLNYELTRRRLRRDVNELWWYIRGMLERIQNEKGSNIEDLLQQTLSNGQHRYSTLLVILEDLAFHDGYQNWRDTEHQLLSEMVQKRIYTLQNPQNCSNARYSVCRIDKGCGIGCELHHIVHCFIVSYATERTLIIDSRHWNYNKGGNGGSFEDIFKPLSDSCVIDLNDKKSNIIASWPGRPDSRIVEIPFHHLMKPPPDYLPPSIPEDLADRLIRMHGNPIVWWIGQFFKYLLRPNEETFKLYTEAEKERDPSKPLVGVHIRRTDKIIAEAQYHSVDEYMVHVENYFQQQEIKYGFSASPKQVFIATDDSKVFTECRQKYPDYTFIGDESRAKSASVTSRFSLDSLKKTMVDIHMLSISDYIVCTFSSNLGRLAYEIQQQKYPDASWRVKSLDDIWYFAGGDNIDEVILPHVKNSPDEINLQKGDVINSLGNHWNGYSKGKIKKSNTVGMYPLYKTKRKIKIAKFPTYSHVKL